MNERKLNICVAAVAIAFCTAAAAESMRVTVDATKLPRKLLHADITFAAPSESITLWYPKWIPGIHAPRGPIENLSGLRFEGADGAALSWHRDPLEEFRFQCAIPAGSGALTARLDYICNQPSTNSTGIDSYGNAFCGIINWNTCLLYPEGVAKAELEVRLSLRLPEGWQYATALGTDSVEGGVIHFKPASLEEVIDSPLICGENLRSIPLEVKGIAPVTLAIVSESEGALQLGDDRIEQFANIASEAGALFQDAPFEQYTWLVACSDDFPSMGLEHLSSSLNGTGERDLIKEEAIQGWSGGLLPHEFVHAWCGKFRRPAGMATTDYHTNKDTRLLWVYEGLTTYLGNLLAVRGGLWDEDHFREMLAYTIGNLMHQTGREWRSLEDTASDSYHLRERSASWSRMRRSQDYYREGMLLWIEADAIIRIESDGRQRLDDFCASFLGRALPRVPVLPYTQENLMEVFRHGWAYDWEGFFRTRVFKPQAELPLELVSRLGYRLEYGAEPSEYMKAYERERKFVYAQDSIGISISNDGTVSSDVVPGMPAAESGMAPGMKVIGVNDRKFSPERLRDALADSVTKRSIRFLVLDGERFETYEVAYDGGQKYLSLVRDPKRPDVLHEIVAPRRDAQEAAGR